MLLEILEIFRRVAVAIVEGGVKTSMTVIRAVLDAAGVVKSDASTSSPIELFLVLLFFAAFIYLLYKFIWGSAKTILIFLLVLGGFLILFFLLFF